MKIKKKLRDMERRLQAVEARLPVEEPAPVEEPSATVKPLKTAKEPAQA
jgi:hypothetical protein